MKQHVLINIHGEKKKLSKHDAEQRRRECESAAATAAAAAVTLTVDGAPRHPPDTRPLSHPSPLLIIIYRRYLGLSSPSLSPS